MNSIKRVTIGLIAALAGVSSAEPTQHPVRLNINSDIVSMLFHRGDQRMLDSFADLPMAGVEETLTDSRFSIKPQEGVAMDSYDF